MITENTQAETLTTEQSDWLYKSYNRTGGTTYYPYIGNQITSSVAGVTTTKSINSLDDYGTPTQITITTTNDVGDIKFTSTVNNSDIYNNESNWMLGLVRQTDVTNVMPANSISTSTSTTQARKTNYEYNYTYGVMSKEILEQNTEHEMSKAYDYDYSNGNTLSVTTRGSATTINSTSVPFETRTSITEYTPNGYFVSSVTNALGHKQEFVYNPTNGNPSEKKDINGLKSTFIYDQMGRLFKTTMPDGNWMQTSLNKCDGANSLCEDDNGEIFYQLNQASGQGDSYVFFDSFSRKVRTLETGFSSDITQRFNYYHGKLVGSTNKHAEGETPYWSCIKTDRNNRIYREFLPSQITLQEFELDVGPCVFTDGYRILKVNKDYNYDGLTTTVTQYNYDAAGVSKPPQTKKTIKNIVGKVVEIEDSIGGKLNYEYDPFGNMVLLRASADGKNIDTTMTYNIRGHKMTMNDPDTGNWQYKYDVVGQLLWQKDAGLYTVDMRYDKLGRMISRYESGKVGDSLYETTLWEYDTATNGKGALANVKNAVTGYEKSYTYDNLSRVKDETITYQGSSYIYTTTYDSRSRVYTTQYPSINGSRLKLRNEYDSNGFLTHVRNHDDPARIYWQFMQSDSAGNIQTQKYGNSFNLVSNYNPQFNRLVDTYVSTGEFNAQYAYDALGNMESRNYTQTGVNYSDEFTYDQLNRLDTATVNGQSLNYDYDGLGNIITKSNFASSYLYGTTTNKPHAVQSVIKNGNSSRTYYAYNNKGLMTSGDGRSITYTSYGKPQRITKGGNVSEFTYGPDRNRIKQLKTVGGLTTTILYLNGAGQYEKEIDGSKTTHKLYINVAGSAIGVLTKTEVNSTITEKIHYFIADHLGSINMIVDEQGYCEKRFVYNPFGKQTEYNCGSLDYNETHGYTGHEHLAELDLIHMNGRVYDYNLGRFISADPFVQSPSNTQSLNRYTYVWNNPLAMTDPSGYIVKPLKWVLNNTFAPAIESGAFQTAFQASFIGIAASTGIGGAMAAGFLMPYVQSNGDIKAGITGAVSAGMFHGVGEMFDGSMGFSLGKMAAHGTVGGVQAEMMGGSFENGFAAALVSNGLSQSQLYNALAGSSFVGHALAAGTVGGLTSTVIGGRFEDSFRQGAMAAMYGEIFNACQHNGCFLMEKLKARISEYFFSPVDEVKLSEQQKAAIKTGMVAAGQDMMDASQPIAIYGIGIAKVNPPIAVKAEILAGGLYVGGATLRTIGGKPITTTELRSQLLNTVSGIGAAKVAGDAGAAAVEIVEPFK